MRPDGAVRRGQAHALIALALTLALTVTVTVTVTVTLALALTLTELSASSVLGAPCGPTPVPGGVHSEIPHIFLRHIPSSWKGLTHSEQS